MKAHPRHVLAYNKRLESDEITKVLVTKFIFRIFDPQIHLHIQYPS